MKIRKWLLAAAVLLAVVTLAGCASSDGGGSAKPAAAPAIPVPEGAERVMLDNGSYAIYRFDLPAGTKWSDYKNITVDYMVDEVNIVKSQRNKSDVRLMGNYKEEQFPVSFKNRIANLQEGVNGPYIIDNTPRTFASMGAVANEWFTVEYDISGTKGHAQFLKSNLPAPSDTGPFFFGVGIPSMDQGRRNGITQLIRNVTLHHAYDPALSVVSKGSGFEEATFLSYYPVASTREGPSN